MRNYTIVSTKNNVALTTEELHAELDRLIVERQAADTADFDLIAPAVEALFDAYPKMNAFPTSMLIEAAFEAATEQLRAEGKTVSMTDKVALRNRLSVSVPEYVKSVPDQLHTSRKAGVRVRFSGSENAAESAPRISEEEWDKLTAEKPAKAPKGEKTDA